MDTLWHVIYVAIVDDKPQISWSVFNTADDAYVDAAYALKRVEYPLGYFIGCKEIGGPQAIVETFLPLGGPHRFDMKRVGDKFEVFLDGNCITCVGEQV